MTAGKIVWRELIARNRDSVTPFYAELLGWEIKPIDMGPELGTYQMAHANGKSIGGFDTGDGTEDPPHWLVYIQVPDSVEATTERAVAAGGSIVRPPHDLHGIGRNAVLRDIDGAVFCAFAPNPPETPVIDDPDAWPPSVGSISWYAVAGTDLTATAAFYSTVFGYDPAGPDEVYSNTNTPVLMTGEKMQAGVLSSSEQFAPQWVIYVVVKSASDTLNAATAAGATLITPIIAVPQVGRILGLKDPIGANFFVHEP